MAVRVPDVGELRMLEMLAWNKQLWSIRLYKNDYEPVDSTITDHFDECDFPGYAAQDMSEEPAIHTNAAGKAQATWQLVTFGRSITGPAQTAYGYYVFDGEGFFLFAERFAEPLVFQDAGDQYQIRPILTLRSEYDDSNPYTPVPPG